MSNYEKHILYLIYAMLSLLALFILTFAYDAREVWFPSLAGIIVLVGVIAVLARWNGDRGKTD